MNNTIYSSAVLNHLSRILCQNELNTLEDALVAKRSPQSSVVCAPNAPQQRHTTCTYLNSVSNLAFFILPRHLLLSTTPLPPTLSTHFSVISVHVQNRPAECLAFSPNHFKAAVLQQFSFQLPYSNTGCCTLSPIWSPLPSASTFTISLLQHLSIPFTDLFTLFALQPFTSSPLVSPHGNTGSQLPSFSSPAICSLIMSIYFMRLFPCFPFCSSIPHVVLVVRMTQNEIKNRVGLHLILIPFPPLCSLLVISQCVSHEIKNKNESSRIKKRKRNRSKKKFKTKCANARLYGKPK